MLEFKLIQVNEMPPCFLLEPDEWFQCGHILLDVAGLLAGGVFW